MSKPDSKILKSHQLKMPAWLLIRDIFHGIYKHITILAYLNFSSIPNY